MEETLLLILIAICYVGFGFKALLYFIKSVAFKSTIFRIVIFFFWFVVPIGIVFGGKEFWEDD